MRQRQSRPVLSIILILVVAAFSCGFAKRPAATPGLVAPQTDPPWCDQDGDGFCPTPIWSDCNDNDPSIHPGAKELGDFIDSNCSGFGDEPPIGFKRQDYATQGTGSAVEWYGDYVYLAAASVLQVYHAPPGAEPSLLDYEVEFRDWAREMAVDGDTLFVAARGDGLYAFDLGQDSSHPTPAGHVSSRFDAGGYTDIEAVFNGVHASAGRVAVARANGVGKSQGGVDAIVFEYNPTLDSFTPVGVITTAVRSRTESEIPISVALTEDASGLYIGYGALAGELVYLEIDDPSAPVFHGAFGGVLDIAPQNDKAFAAITGFDLSGADVSMLSRVSMISETLVEEPIIVHEGSSAGMAVDIHQDLLCFATWSPGRYEDGYNLWTYTDLLADTPTRIGAAGTLDWVYQLACRHSETGPDWVYVADEWGGLEIWQSDRGTLVNALTLDLEHNRFATGALSVKLWNDGTKIYSAEEGAGLWVFDESAPHEEQVAVEWIDRFVSSSTPTLRLYQHCPAQPDQVRFLVEIAMPSQGIDMDINDVAVYGDYFFVAEVHNAPLALPDSGTIHVYRWKEPGDLAACPDQPQLLSPQYPLGSFGSDLIPRRLVIDSTRNRLLVGATTKPTFVIKEGGLWFYDLNNFNPNDIADMDNHRTDITPDESIRVTYSSVYDILLDGDGLYIVDSDNGLYRYSLNQETYIGFYPAHRGTTSQTYEPQLVLSPPGVIPLHYPVAVALLPSGSLMVQEHVSGRVSILQAQGFQPEYSKVYLPLVSKQ